MKFLVVALYFAFLPLAVPSEAANHAQVIDEVFGSGGTENPAFSYKSVDDFKRLEVFDSVKAFEVHYAAYTEHCRDKTFGGLGTIPCNLSARMWNRERVGAESNLNEKLDVPAKPLRAAAEFESVNSILKDHRLSETLADEANPMKGTMFDLIRADEVTDQDAERIKSVVLLKRAWLSALAGSSKPALCLVPASRSSKEIDVELNKAFGALRDVLTPETKLLLKEAQRAWLAWRDAEMRFAKAAGISARATGLLDALAERRTNQLASWMQIATQEPEPDEAGEDE